MNIRNKPKRLKLKEWAKMESLMRTIKEYVKRGGYEPVGDIIIKIINMCGVSVRHKRIPWYETVAIFSQTQLINKPTVEIPMLKTKEKGQQPPWDYPERDWAWWVNLFASKYGWKEDDIAELDVDDALMLYQEIQVDDQLEKEWLYGLSELAYEYVPSTKKSKFRPLPRPDWMLVTKENYKPKEPKKVKIRRDMLPIGNIVNLDKEEDANATTKPS